MFILVSSLPSSPLVPCCDIFGNIKPLYGFWYPHPEAEERFPYQELFSWFEPAIHTFVLIWFILPSQWKKNILSEKGHLIKLYLCTVNHECRILD